MVASHVIVRPSRALEFLPPTAKGTMIVDVKDSQHGNWQKSFSVPNVSN